jgi:hypothetical protein
MSDDDVTEQDAVVLHWMEQTRAALARAEAAEREAAGLRAGIESTANVYATGTWDLSGTEVARIAAEDMRRIAPAVAARALAGSGEQPGERGRVALPPVNPLMQATLDDAPAVPLVAPVVPDSPDLTALYGIAVDAGANALGYAPLPETYIKVVRAAIDAVLAVVRPTVTAEQAVER